MKFFLVMLVALAVAAKTVAAAGAQPGDFLIATVNTTVSHGEKYVLQGVSAKGAVRFSLTYPEKGAATGYPWQTAIAPDGKFAFVTYQLPGKRAGCSQYIDNRCNCCESAILVIQLSGNPKVINAITLPASKCKYMSARPIAVGPVSNLIEYPLYIGRTCFAGCKDKNDHSSIEVVKLTYNISSGKLTESKKKVYEHSEGKCVSGPGSEYLALQVLNGTLYGITSPGSQLVQVSTGYNAGTPDLNLSCSAGSFAIPSPTSFYGLCGRSGHQSIYFVNEGGVAQNKKKKDQYYGWQASVATQPGSGLIYVISDDNIIYKFDAKLSKLPTIAFNIPPSVFYLRPRKYSGSISFEQLLIVPSG